MHDYIVYKKEVNVPLRKDLHKLFDDDTCYIVKDEFHFQTNIRLGCLVKIRSMHDGVLFGSKFVGLFISCEKPNNVVILYNSKPQRLLVPSFNQLVDFAFKSPFTKLHKVDSKLEQVC